MTQEVLLYDVVHDYIISENFAPDTEGANKVMLKLSDELMQEIYERTMTASEKRKDTMLKKKYDDSDMKKNMQAQYGKEEGKKVYFATIRKQAMKKEEVESVEEKIKYDKSGSSMDYFLGADPKKTEYYKKNAKKKIKKEEVIPEAKYEAGASTYGKATIRNKRKFGTSGELPDIMTGKKITKDATRGELITKRREEHKAKRGMKEEVEVDASVSEDFYKKKYDVKKGGYVKTDKMDKSNKRSGDSKAQYREVHKDLAKEAYSANPRQQAAIAISKKDRLEKMLVAKKKKQTMNKEEYTTEMVRKIKKKISARAVFPTVAQNKVKGEIIKGDDLKIDNKNPVKKKKQKDYFGEEGYDIARDEGRVRPSKDKKDATTMPPSKEMMKTRKVNKGPSAFDRVKAKYGKSVMDVK